MAIYKNKDIETNIDATSVNLGNIGAQFYTNDENSASIRIYVKHNGVPINFEKTEFKPILKLSMEDGSYFDNEQLDIILAEKGVVQYKISEKVIKHTGKVKAVLVLKNDSQTIHASDFLFTILDSGFNDKVAKEINVDLIGDKIEEILIKNASKFKGEKGDKMTFADLTDKDKQELKGDKGEQGPKGDTGSNGIKGEKGDKGDKGDTLKYSELSQTEKEELKSNITDQAVTDFVLEDGDITSSKIADKAITPDKTNFIVSGKNKFDKNKALIGKVLNSDNTMVDSPTYDVSHNITLSKNEQITISKLRNYCFVDDETNTVTHDTTTRYNYTFVAPDDGVFRFTLYHDDLDTTQVEDGSTATTYEPYYLKLSDDISLNKVEVDSTSNYILNKNENNIDIITLLNGKNLEIRTVKNGSRNDSLNFDRAFYDSKLVHALGDDITPVRTFTTVGANHGYTSIIDLPNSNKKTADLGSTWTDGTTNYVLLRIVDGRLILGCPYTIKNGYVTASTVQPKANLTHVSNAINTSDISISGAKTGSQLYPSTGKINVTYLADENIISQDGTYKCNTVTIIENYEILDYKSIVDFATSNIGKDYANYRDEIQGVLSMSNTFNFNNKGNCTTSHAIRALQKVLMGMSGVLQSVVLQHPTLPVKRYVPNLGVVNGFDFTQPFNVEDYNVNNQIVKENLIEQDKPLDRYIDYIVDGNSVELAFTMGHIIDKTNSSYEDRLTNISSIYWDFRNTKKSYPNVIHNKILNEGDYFNFEGYRNYFVPDNGVINSNKVIDNETTYIYIDSLNTENYKSTEFSELIGSKLEVVSSKGFELKSNIVDANGINYAITENKGYAVLKTV